MIVRGNGKNMLSQFGCERNYWGKPKSGQGTDELYKCTWRYFDALSFISATFLAGRSTDTINDVSENNTSGSQETSCDIPCQPSSQKRKRALCDGPKMNQLHNTTISRMRPFSAGPTKFQNGANQCGQQNRMTVFSRILREHSRRRALQQSVVISLLPRRTVLKAFFTFFAFFSCLR